MKKAKRKKQSRCEWVQLRLLEYVRKELPKHHMGRVTEHIRTGCGECVKHLKLEVELNKPLENSGARDS